MKRWLRSTRLQRISADFRLSRIRRRPAAVALLVLAGALLATGAVLVQADNQPNGITVVGQGVASLPPDEAVISGSVQVQAPTAADALQQASQGAQAVASAARAFSGKVDVQTTTINVYPQYSYPQPGQPGTPGPPSIVGYQAASGVTVKTTDLASVGDLIQAVVTAGLNQFNGVQFVLVNPEQLRDMALQAAIADAQQQAQTAAAALGVQLGAVVNFTTQFNSAGPVPFGTVGPVPPAAARAAGPAALPGNGGAFVQPGPLDATASVVITYAILNR